MAVDLNGSTQFLRNYSFVPSSTGTFTIGARVWADSRPNYGSILKNWGDLIAGQFHFGLESTDGDLSIYIIQADTTAITTREGVALATGAWHSVIGQADGSNIKIFRAGAQVGSSVAYDGTLLTSRLGLGVGVKLNDSLTGAGGAGNAGYWDGRICDVFCSTGVWTAAEILAYSNGYSPSIIRRGVTDYYRLIRPGAAEPNVFSAGGFPLTSEASPSAIEHPLVFDRKQVRQFGFGVPAGAAAGAATGSAFCIPQDAGRSVARMVGY